MPKAKDRINSPGLKKILRSPTNENINTSRIISSKGENFDPRKLIEYENILKEILIQELRYFLAREVVFKNRAKVLEGVRFRLKNFLKMKNKEVDKIVREAGDGEKIAKIVNGLV